MIIVMGTPGAGKSTVLSELKKARKEWAFINYGDMMLKAAQEKKLVKSRDELRTLSIPHQREIQATVAEELARMKGNVVLDTHCSVNTPNGYYPGLPHPLLQKLKVDALVLITAPTKDILARRKTDATRARDEQNPAALEEHLRVNEAMLAAYSVLTGAPVSIVQNANGALDSSVGQVERLLDAFKV